MSFPAKTNNEDDPQHGRADLAFTMKQYVQTDLEAAAESGMIMRLHTRTIRPGVSCVAFTSSVMLDMCGTQRRKTLIAWRCCW
jgi:hypothetical protein